MPLTRIISIVVRHLELRMPPVDDLAEFRQDLGVDVETTENGGLVLTRQGSHCELRFDRENDALVLSSVRVLDDTQGRFFSEVLGRLLIAWEGSLDALVNWSVPKGPPEHVIVKAGKTEYPLLVSLVQKDLREEVKHNEKAETHLEAGRAAWEEYQRLKSQKDKGTSGS